MRLRTLLVAGGALLLLGISSLAIGACVAAGKDAAGGVADGRLVPCPSSPNCVCSESSAGDAAIEPLAFPGEPGAALASLVEHLRARPRVELVSVEADYVHAVFRSALFRFPDDVEFRLDRAAHVIHVRSASRIGRSDLGANRRRVEALRLCWSPSVSR
jgi:uncharacterized protein (DUF1499 family)